MFTTSPVSSPQHNLQQILSQDTISARIDSLSKFFSQAALRDQHSAYPSILANVFGYDQSSGWGLTKLTPTSDPVTFRVVSSFLEPTGPLFALTWKLEQANLFYEFPLSCLPPPSQANLISPVKLTPDFYKDKLPPVPPCTLPSKLQLRALDFFSFHFAYFLIYSQHLKHRNPSPGFSHVWESISTCLYTSLLDSYLNHFLPLQPLNRSPSPSHNKFSTSPTRFSSLRASPPRDDVRRRQNSSLLRTDLLTESPHRGSPLLGVQGVREGYGGSIRFLETLVEFWLRQVEPSNPVENYLGRGAQQQTHFMTEAHARFVRVLCKHLHFWTARNPSYSDLSHTVLRQPLFQFLRYCLAHWPHEPSYRMLLELWLTQIQPWRYEDTDKQAKSGHATKQQIDAKWSEFVSINLPFYSTLFVEFLPRAFRLDLSNTRDVVVLSRVTRVFSQPGLPELIRHGEGVVSESGVPYSRSRLLPDRQELQFNIVELMGSANAFTPMMTSQTLQGIDDVRKSIGSVLNNLSGENADNSGGRGIFSRLKEWLSKIAEPEEDELDGAMEGNIPKKEKLRHTLHQCLHYFNCLFPSTDSNNQTNEFDVSVNESQISPNLSNSFSRISTHKPRVDENIMNNPDNVYKLEYMGDPVVRPIQPHENKFLCKHLHRLSLFINRKFSPQLMYLSQNPELWISRAASIFLNERPPPTPLEDPLQVVCEIPRLRINLRPLSSYHILSLLFICYTLPTMIGITSLQFICICTFFFTVFFIYHYVTATKD